MTTPESTASYRAQDNLGFCLSRAALIMQTAVDSALLGLGLSRLSWTVLACIRFDGIQSPSQIAKFVGLERTTASRIISRLETDGFVSRQPDHADGRGHRVELTAQGYDASERAPALIHTATHPYLVDVSENEVGQLVGLLKRIGAGTVADWGSVLKRQP